MSALGVVGCGGVETEGDRTLMATTVCCARVLAGVTVAGLEGMVRPVVSGVGSAGRGGGWSGERGAYSMERFGQVAGPAPGGVDPEV